MIGLPYLDFLKKEKILNTPLISAIFWVVLRIFGSIWENSNTSKVTFSSKDLTLLDSDIKKPANTTVITTMQKAMIPTKKVIASILSLLYMIVLLFAKSFSAICV
jgi:hypothetical protein